MLQGFVPIRLQCFPIERYTPTGEQWKVISATELIVCQLEHVSHGKIVSLKEAWKKKVQGQKKHQKVHLNLEYLSVTEWLLILCRLASNISIFQYLYPIYHFHSALHHKSKEHQKLKGKHEKRYTTSVCFRAIKEYFKFSFSFCILILHLVIH